MNSQYFLALFEETANELVSTVRQKNQDYSGGEDPFKNFRMAERLGVCSIEVGIFTRMLDKVTRAANLLEQKPAVVSESMQDTLKDLAAYAIILSIYLEKFPPQKKTTAVYLQENCCCALPHHRKVEFTHEQAAAYAEALKNQPYGGRIVSPTGGLLGCPIGCFKIGPHVHKVKRPSPLPFGWPWWAFFALGVVSGLIRDVVRWAFSL